MQNDRLPQQKTDMASKCLIQIKLIDESDIINLKYKWTTASKKDQELNSTLIQIIVDQFFKIESIQIQHEGIELIGFTIFFHNNLIYRAALFLQK